MGLLLMTLSTTQRDTRRYALQPDGWQTFAQRISERPDIHVVIVITDSDRIFQRVRGEIPDSVQTVRLYETYLSEFANVSGRNT